MRDWAADVPGADCAQRRRAISVSLYAGDPRRGVRPQSRLAGGTEADPVRLLHRRWSRCRAALLEQGVAAVTAADTRWARRDIKSTALLANILLKKLAADAGAFETIMLENGELTEGSSTTVHVVQGRRHPHAAERPSHSAGHHSRCGHRTRRPPVGCAAASVPRDGSGAAQRRRDLAGILHPRRTAGHHARRRARSAAASPVRCSSECIAAFTDYMRELAGTPAL